MKLSGIYGGALGGITGAVVTAYKSSRFGANPAETTAPPSGTPTGGPVTTATSYGCAGGWQVTVTTVTTYWVSVVFNEKRYWAFYPLVSTNVVGAAGGDLSGTYPNPTVAKIRGHNVATTAPTANEALIWTGSNTRYAPLKVATVVHVASPLSATTTSGIELIQLTNGVWTAGGDLSGTYPNPTVVKIQGHAVTSASPAANDFYVWTPSGSHYVLTRLTTKLLAGTHISKSTSLGVVTISATTHPTGSAGGGLTGSYPTPTVAKAPSGSVVAGVGVTISTTSGKAKFSTTTITLVTKTTGWTAALTTAGKLVVYTSTSGHSVTLKKHATIAWPTGSIIIFMQKNTGQLTVAAGATVTLHTPTTFTPKTRARYSQITAVYMGSTVWTMSGDLAA